MQKQEITWIAWIKYITVKLIKKSQTLVEQNGTSILIFHWRNVSLSLLFITQFNSKQ